MKYFRIKNPICHNFFWKYIYNTTMFDLFTRLSWFTWDRSFKFVLFPNYPYLLFISISSFLKSNEESDPYATK